MGDRHGKVIRNTIWVEDVLELVKAGGRSGAGGGVGHPARGADAVGARVHRRRPAAPPLACRRGRPLPRHPAHEPVSQAAGASPHAEGTMTVGSGQWTVRSGSRPSRCPLVSFRDSEAHCPLATAHCRDSLPTAHCALPTTCLIFDTQSSSPALTHPPAVPIL